MSTPNLALAAAAHLVDRAATTLDPDLDWAADVASALAGAAARRDLPTGHVRAWLYTDYAEAHAILAQHGTTGSYISARSLALHTQATARQRITVAGLIGDALTDAELDVGEPVSYDYAQDPRPPWIVHLSWADGTTSVDQIKAETQPRAYERAAWNWPDAAIGSVVRDQKQGFANDTQEGYFSMSPRDDERD